MISLITTYYNEPEHLEHFLEINTNNDVYSEIIIVDDGSKEDPAELVCKQFSDLPIKLFRVKEDLGFNSHGARNLAMKHATNSWALLTDIDRKGFRNFGYILERYILSSRPKEYFNWMTSYGERTVNDYCIRVEDFWVSGGYDEETVNKHWGDRLFLERIDSYLEFTTIMHEIYTTRRTRSWSSSNDIDKTVYPDDDNIIHPKWDTNEKNRLETLIRARNNDPNLWIRDNIIQFDWERII